MGRSGRNGAREDRRRTQRIGRRRSTHLAHTAWAVEWSAIDASHETRAPEHSSQHRREAKRGAGSMEHRALAWHAGGPARARRRNKSRIGARANHHCSTCLMLFFACRRAHRDPREQSVIPMIRLPSWRARASPFQVQRGYLDSRSLVSASSAESEGTTTRRVDRVTSCHESYGYALMDRYGPSKSRGSVICIPP